MEAALELFRPMCNGSVRVEPRTDKLTGYGGFLLLRELSSGDRSMMPILIAPPYPNSGGLGGAHARRIVCR